MNAVEDRLRAALQAKADGLASWNTPMPSADSDEVIRLAPAPTGHPPRRLVTAAVAALVAAAVAVTVLVTVSRSATGSNPIAPTRGRAEIPWSQVGDGWALVQTNPPSDLTVKNRVDQLDLIDPAGVRYLIMNLAGTQWTLSSWTRQTGMALLIDYANAGVQNSVVQLDLHTGQHQEFVGNGAPTSAQYAGSDGSVIVLGNTQSQVAIASLDGRRQVPLPDTVPGGGQVQRLNPVVSSDGELLAVGSGTGVAIFTVGGKFVRWIAAPAGYTLCETSGLWPTNAITASCVVTNKQGLKANTVIFPLDGKSKSRVMAPIAGPPWQLWTLTGGQLAYRQDQGLGGEFARISSDGKLTSIPPPAALNGMQWEVHGASGSYVSIQFWTDYAKHGLLSFDPFTGKTTVLYSPGTAPSTSPIVSAPWNFAPFEPQ